MFLLKDLKLNQIFKKNKADKAIMEISKTNEIKKSFGNEDDKENRSIVTLAEKLKTWKKNIIWQTLVFLTLWHIIALYGFIILPFSKINKLTVLWFLIYGVYSIFGMTGGVLRLWSHRSYKAKMPLRILLALAYYSSGMIPIRQWVKLHRIHHKYSDTDADPHFANRGLFFSHIGWLYLKRHPEFMKRINEIDMTDINEDPVVNFGDKHFLQMLLLMMFIVPSMIPILLWNESWYWSILSQTFMRTVIVLEFIFLINSFAHSFGSKPFNRDINPSENRLVSIVALGEGWHNYHHVFPWDYRAGGIRKYDLNVTTFFIQQFAKIGWAYDLKTADNKLILATCKKRGDGTLTNFWDEVPVPNKYSK